MPEKKSDYVSEGGQVQHETMAGKFVPKGIEFSKGKVRNPNMGKTIPLDSGTSDQASFTGSEDGFFKQNEKMREKVA